MRLLLVFLLILAIGCRAAEPLLKPNDVVALVGGEDMVVANELGYLEALCQATLPEYHLKFRSIAWEGDTVYEQKRDLNYPPLEAQLERMGATTVVAQFGKIESLNRNSRSVEFIDAYTKLIKRLSDNGKRRVVLVEPRFFEVTDDTSRATYRDAIASLAKDVPGVAHAPIHGIAAFRRDGGVPTPVSHYHASMWMAYALIGDTKEVKLARIGKHALPVSESVQALVAAKNRLWFHYTRPQNWAFLAGDRTNQPSSRDHLDKSKRWFPEEMEQFLPLIEAKEKAIWAKAAELKGQAK